MKRIAQLMAVMMLGITANAQDNVTTRMISYDDEMHSAVSTTIDVPKDEAMDYFEEFMEDTYDVKVKGGGLFGGDDLSVEQATVPRINSKKLDLFVSFEDAGDKSTVISMAGRNGYDLWFNKKYEPETFKTLMSAMGDYRVHALTEYKKMKLDEQKDDLKDVDKDIEKTSGNIKDNKEDIQENLKENEKMKDEISQMEKERDELQKKLDDIQRRIEKTNESLRSIRK